MILSYLSVLDCSNFRLSGFELLSVFVHRLNLGCRHFVLYLSVLNSLSGYAALVLSRLSVLNCLLIQTVYRFCAVSHFWVVCQF